MHQYAQYFTQSFSVGGMHSLPPAVVPFLLPVILVLVTWTFIWKGLALWHAARNRQIGWFIIILIVNTLGILEIIYLLFFRKNRNTNVSTTTVTHTTTVVPPVVPPAVPPTTPPAVDSSAPVA